MSLYKIADAMVQLVEMESDEAVLNTLEGLEMEFGQKAENIIFIEKNSESQIQAIDQEIDRLKKRKEAVKNKVERLNRYLVENMEKLDIKKIDRDLFTITRIDGKESVEINDEKKIPDDYVKVDVVVKPKKAEILKAHKDGEEIPGITVKRGDSYLKIS